MPTIDAHALPPQAQVTVTSSIRPADRPCRDAKLTGNVGASQHRFWHWTSGQGSGSTTAVLSYAQNMEDVLISRLFAGQAEGFYIDVGGGHAIADNVTFHAYLSGWRGIVVEPQSALHALYRAVRPRDVLVDALCGREPGSIDMFVADRFHGLSTASSAAAAGAEAAGVAGRMIRQEVTTLAAIADAHAPAAIDLLKIDVEGFEAEVIAGNDWSRHRPRVVLAEAIEPLSMADASARFEPALLAAGYRFAFFDNLNRWYVAQEAAKAFMPRFPSAPLPWDGVRHLGEFGAADQNPAHPDHALARRLPRDRLGRLPLLDDVELKRLGAGETPDRAALGRIASWYDGGYIVD
jgi:FkbM family methyltransferase